MSQSICSLLKATKTSRTETCIFIYSMYIILLYSLGWEDAHNALPNRIERLEFQLLIAGCIL